MTKVLDPPYDGWAEWHEHFFAPTGSNQPFKDTVEWELRRFDAVEDRSGRIFVWDVEKQEPVQVCKTREEACKAAAKLAKGG